ncbi:hypothetical protein C8R44DRAFT_869435 [Mycena epipterygia]|nr:hypothetical protein C8R44DRAFT_869435 [Mycena epipterygia]
MPFLPVYDTFTATRHTYCGTFFKRLPCFTSLQQVSAYRLYFTHEGLINLCRLPVLARLCINTCCIAEDGRSLQMGWNSRYPHSYFATVTIIFPRGLSTTGRSCFIRLLSLSTMCLSILAKFPAVRIFFPLDSTATRGDGTGVQASPILPVLVEYTGPYHALHISLPRPTLTRLTINRCHTGPLIIELHRMRTLRHLVSLDMTFYDMDKAALKTLCGFFPQLTDLHIHIVFQVSQYDNLDTDVNPKPASFVKTVAESVALPRTLIRLAISWEFECDFESMTIPEHPIRCPSSRICVICS